MQLLKTQKSTDGQGTTRRVDHVRVPKGHHITANGKVSHRPLAKDRPMKFIAVDGEGMTINGEHKYILFGVGSEQIENPDGLEWKEIFEFLYSKRKDNTAFVGFFLGYDFTQIIKSLPEDRAYMLITSEGRALRKHRIKGKAPHPVEYRGWQFDMLGFKRLRIRPKTCECPYPTCKCEHAPWMYICDAGAFFQSSLLTVIDPKKWPKGTEVVTPEEYAIVKEGKERRSTAVLDDDMRRYNVLENEILSRVMRTVDQGFKEIGISLSPSQWFGPGQAASEWLKQQGVPKREDIQALVPPWFLEAARMSYFGGWFEIAMHGIIPGITHEYDINSAYPSVIAELPCLLHGTYTYGDGLPEVNPNELCLVYAKVTSPHNKNAHIGAMLHRSDDGSISRPLGSMGWYWWDELKAAESAKFVATLVPPIPRLKYNRARPWAGKYQSEVMKWVKYEPCDCPPPMRGIRDLYEKRLSVGKDTPLGKGAKLVYNSDYGKFAQSVGEPIFGNPIYASRITSGCRTVITKAIASHPKGKKAVAMIATDAVYFLDPHPKLPISDKLGEWDHKEKVNLTLFKPGVYWDDTTRKEIAEEKSVHFKARGFKASDFISQIDRIDNVFKSWSDPANWPKEHIWFGGLSKAAYHPGGFPMVQFTPTFAMVTALQALRRGKWTEAGKVSAEPKPIIQDADPSGKRYQFYRDSYGDRVIYRSRPHDLLGKDGNGNPEWQSFDASYPYVKRFGMEDPYSDEFRQQFGENFDGNIADVLGWILVGGE